MNHAQPVSSACSTRGQQWPRARAARARTLQRLDPDGVFAARAGLVALAAGPVAPARDVVEALVELAVLEVALGHEARAAGGVDEVVEADGAGRGGGARGPVLVRGGDGAAGGVVVRKVEGGDLGVLEDGDAGRGGVAEEELVERGAHDVPRAVVVEEGVKVGVALALVLGELERGAGLRRGGEGVGAGRVRGDIPCG